MCLDCIMLYPIFVFLIETFLQLISSLVYMLVELKVSNRLTGISCLYVCNNTTIHYIELGRYHDLTWALKTSTILCRVHSPH